MGATMLSTSAKELHGDASAAEVDFPSELVSAMAAVVDSYHSDPNSTEVNGAEALLKECANILSGFPSVLTVLLPCGEHAEMLAVTCTLLKAAGPHIPTTNPIRTTYEGIYHSVFKTMHLVLIAETRRMQKRRPAAQSPAIFAARAQLLVQCDALLRLYALAARTGCAGRLWHRMQWQDALNQIGSQLSSTFVQVLTAQKGVKDPLLTQSFLQLASILPRLEAPAFDMIAALKQGCSRGYRELIRTDGLASGYKSLSLHEVYVDVSGREVALAPVVGETGSEISAIVETAHRFDASTPCTASSLLGDSSQRRCVILGGPGCGKSSACIRLVTSWASTSATTSRPGFVPLLGEVSKYADWKCRGGTGSIEAYICQGGVANTEIDPESLMHLLRGPATSALVVLDGLDEVPDPAVRRAVLGDMITFSAAHADFPSLRILVTTRVVGYETSDLPGWSHYMVAPLSSVQVEEFIHGWHESTDMKLQRETRLLDGVRTDPVLSELSLNPLLLTMLCVVNRGPVLPNEKLVLYAKASEILLSRWRYAENRIVGVDKSIQECINYNLTLSRKHAMMCDIAWSMQAAHSCDSDSDSDGHLRTLISRNALLSVIQTTLTHHTDDVDSGDIADALVRLLEEHHGVLCFLGGASYSFIHRTFLEYYVAKAVELQWNDRAIDEEGLCNIFIAHVGDASWYEVLGHLCGLLHARFVVPCLRRLRDDSHLPLLCKCIPMLRGAETIVEELAQETHVRLAALHATGSAAITNPHPSDDHRISTS